MALRYVIPWMITTGLFLITACGPKPDPPRPSVVSHLDLSEKKTLIERARTTIEIFHDTAVDLRRRGDQESRSELTDQVEVFMASHVTPIVEDFEATNSLETRLHIAELQLLSAMVYLELGKNGRAWSMLKEIEQRYGDRTELLRVSLESNRFGFRNLDDGIRGLREKIYARQGNKDRPKLF